MRRSTQQQSIQLLEQQWLRAVVGRHAFDRLKFWMKLFGMEKLPDFRRFKMRYHRSRQGSDWKWKDDGVLMWMPFNNHKQDLCLASFTFKL